MYIIYSLVPRLSLSCTRNYLMTFAPPSYLSTGTKVIAAMYARRGRAWGRGYIIYSFKN